MILKDIELTEERMVKLNQAQQKEDEKKQIMDYTRSLETQAKELEKDLRWLLEAADAGVEVSREIILDIGKTESRLEQFTDESGETGWERDRFEETRKMLDRLNRKLDEQWTLFYKNKAGDVLSLLRIIKQVEPNETERLERRINDFKNFCTDLSPMEFCKAVDDANELLIRTEIGDKNVKVFLEKIRNRSATLDDITPEVKQWIDKNSLRRRIRISFS